MDRNRLALWTRRLNTPVFLLVLAVALWFLKVPYWAIIGGVMLLVVGHEFGHWATARWLGFKVPVFSVGIFAWPRFGVQLGETEFRVTPWLLGGFVKFDPQSDEFRKAAAWKRFIVLIAGVVMNFIIAFALLFSAYMIKGEPTSTGVLVAQVVAESPAAAAGIQAGDHIISVDGAPLKRANDLGTIVRSHNPGAIVIVVSRKTQTVTVTVHPDAAGHVGVSVGDDGFAYKRVGFSQAVTKSGGDVYNITAMIVVNLASMVHHTGTTSGKALGGLDDLHGPIAIVQMALMAYQGGFFSFVWFLAAISVNLAIFNLLPIPIFDGGQILLVLVEKMRGKPLSDGAQAVVVFIGLYLVLMLFLFGMYNDFFHPIGR